MEDDKYFTGSWAVILGGSSGFGFAAVEKLAKHGMSVADADFVTKNFKSLSQELQDIIIDYSKQSKTLKTASLQ